MFGTHTPNEITCPTCHAGPDRRCGDADGEFAGDVYHAEREIKLIKIHGNFDATPIVDDLVERYDDALNDAMHAVVQQLYATDDEYRQIEATLVRALLARIKTR